ncbi:flavin monoamine oxidase family protein [Nocardia mikamii]|uniref:flavin monoamine oxidase family protein n=1 Tax=Nocardia mikamii TaxID=508464 RepID=UPI0007A41268|nr:FAD-dependent oxidoreductase [Nocardia mikamii]
MATQQRVREQTCEVAVIGAGISGLMAATTLSPTAEVLVLEAADRAGGRVETVRQGDYWINVGTQFTEGTGALIDALEHHKVHCGTLAGKKVALALDGKLVDTANPISLMLRSRMSLRDRIDMAVIGARIISGAVLLELGTGRAAGNRVRAALDAKSAASVLRGVRSEIARSMVRAWSGQWMGCEPEETAATQFVISMGVALADPAKVPNFSLPVGGNQTLTDILAEDLGERLRLRSRVRSVRWTDDAVVIDYTDDTGPVRLRAKRAVVTVPADVALDILPDLPSEYRKSFGDIGYGRYVVVGYFTEEQGPQRWDDYYAVSTPELSFQAMFNHAAALRDGAARKPGGALACFAGGARADELFGHTDDEIIERFSRDLISLYPELDGRLGKPVVRRHHRVVPFWAPGKRASLPTLRNAAGPVHFAGDYQLDMPSLADAAASGEAAARAVLTSL